MERGGVEHDAGVDFEAFADHSVDCDACEGVARFVGYGAAAAARQWMEFGWSVLDSKRKGGAHRNVIPVVYQKEIRVSIAIQEGKEN